MASATLGTTAKTGVQGKLRTAVPKSEKYLAWQQELTSNRAIHGRRRTQMQQPKRQESETEKDAFRQDVAPPLQEDESFDLIRRSSESIQALTKVGLKSCSEIERPVMGVKTTTTQRIKVKQTYSAGAENRRMYSHTVEVDGRKQYEGGAACLRREQGNDLKIGDTPRLQQGQQMATRNSHHQDCVDLDVDCAVSQRLHLPYHSVRVSDSQQHVQQDGHRERKQLHRSTLPAEMEMKKGSEEKDHRYRERERERRKQRDEKKGLEHQMEGRLHAEMADEEGPEESQRKSGENTRQLRERVSKDGRKQLRTLSTAIMEVKETRYRTRYCDSQQLKANGRGVGGGASTSGTANGGVGGSSSAAAGAGGAASHGGHMVAETEAETLCLNVAKRSRRVAERNAREKEPSPPPKKMPKLSVVLSRQDIQEDFLKITGRRYFGKPKKSTLAARGLALCSSLC